MNSGTPHPSRIPQVALLFEPNNAYARSLLLGIGEYVSSQGPWSLHYAELTRHEEPPNWLKKWKGDGIIIRGENRKVARAAARFAGPIVDLTPSRLLPQAPWVKSEDAAIARLAAEHFLERGFQHFAFCGDPQFSWSTWRCGQFAQLLAAAGHPCAIYQPEGRKSTSDLEVDAIARWLLTLPRATGVFACYDNRGQQVLEACRRAGLSVPEEIAVLGVDNDEVLCSLSPPPMSSIRLNPGCVGREAAAMLARMMEGETIAPAAHFIPPVGVVTRQSTDVLAVNDPKVARAVRYIHEHACEGIQVGDVLRNCPMARRALEIRFSRFLGRSPRQEILRVQLNRVKELLVGTDLLLTEIADHTGFQPENLSSVFKRQEGIAPTEFRRRYGTQSHSRYSSAHTHRDVAKSA